MPSDTRALDILTALPPPRVWSMLVTIFGDLAQAPADRIEGPLLTRLTEAMGIRPEAARVALHRLRNDDWISSLKVGRTAQHALTERGRRESRAASHLIYSPPEAMPQGWYAALTASNEAPLREAMQRAGFTQVTPRLFVAAEGTKPPEGVACLSGVSGPAWLAAEVIDAAMTEQYAQLLVTLERVAAALEKIPERAPLTVALLRCLIVHHWRRLVLRHPYLPPALTTPDWPGHLCRRRVTDLLAALPRPALKALHADQS